MNVDKRFETETVKKYRASIEKKKVSLFLKLLFDKVLALILLIPLSPIILGIAIWIKLDSEGPVFYRQERITTYGRTFRIFKFRTMVKDADKLGTAVTQQNDPRISKVGHKLRKLRLDELPQLINVLVGDMSFVGVRPSPASIEYKDEDEVIEKFKGSGRSIDEIYVEEILPDKMRYNLKYIEEFSVINDIKIMIKTAIAVVK